MPREIIVKIEPPPIQQIQPAQSIPSIPTNPQQQVSTPSYYVEPYYPQVREIYPTPFMKGDEYKKNYMRGTIGLRDIDRPFQDITTEIIRVGTVYSERSDDDTVMTLYRRDISPERDLYEYKVVDKTNGNDIELFLSTNINFLRNGDKIVIPGYENKGNFIVNLDTRYRYTMLRPFY